MSMSINCSSVAQRGAERLIRHTLLRPKSGFSKAPRYIKDRSSPSFHVSSYKWHGQTLFIQGWKTESAGKSIISDSENVKLPSISDSFAFALNLSRSGHCCLTNIEDSDIQIFKCPSVNCPQCLSGVIPGHYIR